MLIYRAFVRLAVLCACATFPGGGCASAPATQVSADPAEVDHVVAAVHLRYRDTGGAGPALVLVHGNFDTLASWERVVPALRDHFRVVTLDLPGFGESANVFGTWDYATLALGIRFVLDDAHIERAILVGNSLGGGVVAAFAVRFPERVAGLGLEDANFLDPSVTSPSKALRDKLGPLFQAANVRARDGEDPAARAGLREATRQALMVALVAPGAVDDALVEHFARGFEGSRFEAVKAVNMATSESLESLATDFANTAALRDVPLAIFWGLDDPFLPIENAELIKARHPSARLVLFDGCGHAPHLERPGDLVAAVVSSFGPAPSAVDRFVASPAEPLRFPGWLNQYPFVDQTIRQSLVESQPAELPWLAMNQLASGQFEAAEATMARIPADAPATTRAYRDYVAGALHEVRGDASAAAAAYAKALEDIAPELRFLPIARLALLPLTADQAVVVDAILDQAPGPSEPTAMLIARVDRALARDRWEEALALLDGYRVQVPFGGAIDLRRAIAEWGAGRAPSDHAQSALTALRAVSAHPLATPRERPTLGRIAACRVLVALGRERFDGATDSRLDVCAPTARGRLDFMLGPPPAIAAWWSQALRPISAPRAAATWPSERAALEAELVPARGTALGAVALARIALVDARDADALALLEGVAPDRAAQTPELQRLRLALGAARGRRRALAEARSLSEAHAGSLAWRRVLTTTLGAAGKLRESKDALAALIALAPTRALREELAYVEAALGRDIEARAILGALRADATWQGTPTRLLPHLRSHAAKLWTAP